jgi:hypothetical protein
MRKIKVLLVLFTFIAINASWAQSTSVYEFLKVDMSPRAASLGGSFVSNGDDPDVIFYNPAGIQLLENSPVSFSYVNYLMDINLASLAYSKNIEGIGRFAAAVKYINYGTFTGADESANKTGNFSANELALIVGYANALEENFYYGANVKFIYSGIDHYSSSAFAFDLGLHYSVPDQNLELGASALNLGKQFSTYDGVKEDLPLDIEVGVSKKLAHLPLRLSLDFHRLNEKRDNFGDHFKGFSFGGEFTLSKVLTLRLGYDNEKRDELKIGSTSGLAGFNIGVGIKIKTYQFNYGFSSFGQIGSLQRIGVSTSL